MKSNCNIWAWEEFKQGRTEVIVLRLTKHSRFAQFAALPWWRKVLYPVGVAVGYPAWVSVQLAALLMYGRWWHVTTGTHEFIPVLPKFDRWIPPFRFEGEVCELETPCK